MTMVRFASKKRFFVIFDRTDLRISLSGAKFDAEVDFNVCSAVAHAKPHQIDEKLIFEIKHKSKFFRRIYVLGQLGGRQVS